MSERPMCTYCGASVHVFGQYCSVNCELADDSPEAPAPLTSDTTETERLREMWNKAETHVKTLEAENQRLREALAEKESKS